MSKEKGSCTVLHQLKERRSLALSLMPFQAYTDFLAAIYADLPGHLHPDAGTGTKLQRKKEASVSWSVAKIQVGLKRVSRSFPNQENPGIDKEIAI